MDTLPTIAASKLKDRDIMWLLGSLRTAAFDLADFQKVVDESFEYGTAKVLMEHKVKDAIENLEGMEWEITEIYDLLDITVDDEGEYPVLFRGEKRSYEWIDMDSIECDQLPIGESGFKTAQLVRGNVPIPPIILNKLDSGKYEVYDGRHRYLAFKLNGKKKIPAFVCPTLQEAIDYTNERYGEVFKRLA